MFKRLFNRKKSNRLSKIDYWKKWDFFELFDDLHKAEQFLNSGILKHSNDIENFKEAFIEELYELEGDNVADFTRIWEWFMPGREWDNIIGHEGSELRTKIFLRTDRWKRNQEFVPGTKVSLQNNFGVVLSKSADNNLVGVIRWDTDKENDVEDWRGLFGSFLDAGGQVIDQGYQFKFIDDNGELKQSH